jgi:hypothetical protein
MDPLAQLGVFEGVIKLLKPPLINGGFSYQQKNAKIVLTKKFVKTQLEKIKLVKLVEN